MLWAIAAMTAMIVLLDQLLWRPVVVWAQKFRVDEGGHQEAMSSWFLNWLRRSWILTTAGPLVRGLWHARTRHGGSALSPRLSPASEERDEVTADNVARVRLTPAWARWLSLGIFLALLATLGTAAWALVTRLLWDVTWEQWLSLVEAAAYTLGRVLVATALGTLWALPAGVAIGLSPRLSRILQPVVQVVASFPAPMLFPLVILVMKGVGLDLGWGSIVLMLLGTQWYILFNVIAGAMAIPADLKEAARSYRIGAWQRFCVLYFPAVFPYLVTGWVTAAGGAWNASIVAEYVTFKGEVLEANGLGDRISAAAAHEPEADFPVMAASILVMSAVVVLFNRSVWRRCYELAEKRFSLNK
jgi:NitT/TauT family transport system permease protein